MATGSGQLVPCREAGVKSGRVFRAFIPNGSCKLFHFMVAGYELGRESCEALQENTRIKYTLYHGGGGDRWGEWPFAPYLSCLLD